MFEGVIEQFRPAMHKCEVWSSAVLQRLESIERTIRTAASSDEFGDRIHRIPGSDSAAGSTKLGMVPLDQLWVVDYVWADIAGWTLQLAGVSRYGPGPNLSQANGLVMLPGEEWSIAYTAAINWGLQITRQYRPEKAKRAHTGSGSPEGLTSAQGPPRHERDRDGLPFRVAA